MSSRSFSRTYSVWWTLPKLSNRTALARRPGSNRHHKISGFVSSPRSFRLHARRPVVLVERQYQVAVSIGCILDAATHWWTRMDHSSVVRTPKPIGRTFRTICWVFPRSTFLLAGHWIQVILLIVLVSTTTKGMRIRLVVRLRSVQIPWGRRLHDTKFRRHKVWRPIVSHPLPTRDGPWTRGSYQFGTTIPPTRTWGWMTR